MAGNYSEAIREAYATARSDLVYLDTLEISNPDTGPMYLVQDRQDWNLTLETGEVKCFKATAFSFTLPASGDNGIQDLNIAVDNTDRRVTDFITSVLNSSSPVQVTYRPYIHTDPTTPQMNPPLVLFLTDVNITAAQVTGRATFADVLNRKFLSALYSTRRFPAL